MCIIIQHRLHSLERTHPVSSHKLSNPSLCVLLSPHEQDSCYELRGGIGKVARQGETRQMRRRAHLCRTQGVLSVLEMLNCTHCLCGSETDGRRRRQTSLGHLCNLTLQFAFQLYLLKLSDLELFHNIHYIIFQVLLLMIF